MRRSAICDPIRPAPPVISARLLFMRIDNASAELCQVDENLGRVELTLFPSLKAAVKMSLASVAGAAGRHVKPLTELALVQIRARHLSDARSPKGRRRWN
jgi:hypothetical protein